MPKRSDINKVLVIGSGPIVIGQAAEFDYAGAQACRVLKDAGVNVVLCNSNPATIMTDKALADEIYLEPLTLESIKRIIIKERPDSLLASLGGQTGLTIGCKLAKEGFLDQVGRQAHRHQGGRHRPGGGPRTLQGDHAEDRAARRPLRHRLYGGGVRRGREQDRLSRHHPPRLHAGRRGRRRRL